MHVASETFIDICTEQQVTLDADIVTALSLKNSRDPSSEYFRSPVWYQGAQLMKHLEDGTWTMPMADQLIDSSPMPDVPSRFLARVINASLTGPVADPVPAVFFRYGTCVKADIDWTDLVDDTTYAATVVEVYQDMPGEAAVMRKGIGNPTGILIRPMALGSRGIICPTGSLVRLDSQHDRFDGGRIMREGQITWPLAEINGLSFARLSAIGSPYPERSLHYGNHPYVQAAPDVGSIALLAGRVSQDLFIA